MNFPKKLSEINIRDPFVLLDGDYYYMYGTRGKACSGGKQPGFEVYISADLENWTDSIEVFGKTEDFWADMNYWAPEVHKYNGKYYMFASFKSEKRHRGTQILVSSSPCGRFLPLCDFPVTPPEWECLDGTLYTDRQGVPYMVFCHEWTQVTDGEMCILRLSDDLKKPVGQPKVLFKASEPEWASSKKHGGFITDGPFLHKCADGRLIMIWSGFDKNGYVEAVAYSKDGTVNGEWAHCEKTMSAVNGGHGMIFKSFDGKLNFVMHYPNEPYGAERAQITEIKEIPEEPYLCV